MSTLSDLHRLAPCAIALAALCIGCNTPPATEETGPEESFSLDEPEVADALAAIEASAIESHIRYLADDRLEGRAPGTEGFEGASQYIESAMTELGLSPAGEDGSFHQSVPLQESMVVEEESGLSYAHDGTDDGSRLCGRFHAQREPRRRPKPASLRPWCSSATASAHRPSATTTSRTWT